MKRFAEYTAMALCAATVGAGSVQGGVILGFSQSSYDIKAGGTLRMDVVVDFNDATDVLDPAPFKSAPNLGGLDGFKFRISVSASQAAIGEISVPHLFQWQDPILSYAYSPDVEESYEEGNQLIEVWGKMGIDDSWLGYGYQGTVLATIELHDLGTTPRSQYTVTLAESPIMGSDILTYKVEAIEGFTVASEDVQFKSAILNVTEVPEPASLGLLSVGVLGLLRVRARRR